MQKTSPAASPEAYVAALTGWRRDLVEQLRSGVRSSAELQELVKWGHLVYLSGGPVLLIRAEEERVIFGFWGGRLLRDIEPRLKPGGKYDMASIELRQGSTIDDETIQRLTSEAVRLNATLGDPVRAERSAR